MVSRPNSLPLSFQTPATQASFIFEKDQNMYFYDVVYRKGSFLDYGNVIFT